VALHVNLHTTQQYCSNLSQKDELIAPASRAENSTLGSGPPPGVHSDTPPMLHTLRVVHSSRKALHTVQSSRLVIAACVYLLAVAISLQASACYTLRFPCFALLHLTLDHAQACSDWVCVSDTGFVFPEEADRLRQPVAALPPRWPCALSTDEPAQLLLHHVLHGRCHVCSHAEGALREPRQAPSSHLRTCRPGCS
jgi:hypothetical protein